MRKDEILRRSSRALPPPSAKDWNKKVKPAEESEEERALKGFALAVAVAAIMITFLTASVYALAGMLVVDILNNVGAVRWTIGWADAFTIALVILFSRAWWKASYLGEKK